MMEERVLLYGKNEPLPERVPLRAGPLTMLYENGDLRYIRYGAAEVVRRIYAAARDRAWGTAPNTLSDVRMDLREESFEITYTCENQLNDIDFVWQGHITGASDGAIAFTFDGVARRVFLRNRLGFCVLHPIGAAGAKARIEKVDGNVIESAFPKHIAPQHVVDGIIKPVAPFDEMQAVSHQVKPGVWLRVAFEGEVFEMEDQRNWTDGSFKTYGTPLRLPFPVEVKAGERVRQRVTLSLSEGKSRKAEVRSKGVVGPVTFSLLPSTFLLPQVGMCIAADGKPLSAKQAARLKALKPAHLRVDVPLWETGWQRRLKRAARQAEALGAKLEIALFVSDDADSEFKRFVETRHGASLRGARFLIFHRGEKTSNAHWLALARQHLGKKAVIYGGTNLFFTELNRGRPDAATLKQVDGLCYSFNPQVHAFDNASIAESPEAQAETIRTYKTFGKGKTLAITPITLKPRWNLGDPGPEPSGKAGGFDPRQMSLLGAAWTVASLKHIAQAGGADSITIYETAGKRGVLDGRSVFPMYHVFADVAEFGQQGIATKSSDPLRVEGLALRKGNRTRMVLANKTDQPQTVKLSGIGSKAKVKLLDASNAEAAMKRPESWRAAPSAPLNGQTITLPPYAVARIDSKNS
jgi:hypothetical protein